MRAPLSKLVNVVVYKVEPLTQVKCMRVGCGKLLVSLLGKVKKSKTKGRDNLPPHLAYALSVT